MAWVMSSTPASSRASTTATSFAMVGRCRGFPASFTGPRRSSTFTFKAAASFVMRVELGSSRPSLDPADRRIGHVRPFGELPLGHAGSLT